MIFSQILTTVEEKENENLLIHLCVCEPLLWSSQLHFGWFTVGGSLPLGVCAVNGTPVSSVSCVPSCGGTPWVLIVPSVLPVLLSGLWDWFWVLPVTTVLLTFVVFWDVTITGALVVVVVSVVVVVVCVVVVVLVLLQEKRFLSIDAVVCKKSLVIPFLALVRICFYIVREWVPLFCFVLATERRVI